MTHIHSPFSCTKEARLCHLNNERFAALDAQNPAEVGVRETQQRIEQFEKSRGTRLRENERKQFTELKDMWQNMRQVTIRACVLINNRLPLERDLNPRATLDAMQRARARMDEEYDHLGDIERFINMRRGDFEDPLALQRRVQLGSLMRNTEQQMRPLIERVGTRPERWEILHRDILLSQRVFMDEPLTAEGRAAILGRIPQAEALITRGIAFLRDWPAAERDQQTTKNNEVLLKDLERRLADIPQIRATLQAQQGN